MKNDHGYKEDVGGVTPQSYKDVGKSVKFQNFGVIMRIYENCAFILNF